MKKNFYFDIESPTPIILIGKAGKTIFKTMIQSVFGDQIFLSSDLNNHFDSIDSIQDFILHESCKKKPYLISLELEKIDVDRLLEIIQPQIVVVTNIGDNHQLIKDTKPLLAEKLKELIRNLSMDTIIILNKDDDLVSDLEDETMASQIIKYGLNHQSDFYASEISQNGYYGIDFHLNNQFEFNIPIYQFYQIYNVLSSIIVARLFNMSYSFIQKKINENFNVPEGRSNIHKIASVFVINDSIQNTLTSVTTAAQTLVTFKNQSKRMIMVISDLESESKNLEQLHYNIGYFLAALPIDIIMTVGSYARYISEGIRLINNHDRIVINAVNAEEAVMDLILFLEMGDCILLKASKNSGLFSFVDILRNKLKEN